MKKRKIIIKNPAMDFLSRLILNNFISSKEIEYGEICITISSIAFDEEYLVLKINDRTELLYYDEYSRIEFI